MIERLEAILNRYNEITNELTKPEVLSDIKLSTKLSKEQANLNEVVEFRFSMKVEHHSEKKETGQRLATASRVLSFVSAQGWKRPLRPFLYHPPGGSCRPSHEKRFPTPAGPPARDAQYPPRAPDCGHPFT